MRLLLFSDLHCDVAAARRIVTLAEQADVVVGAGDIGNVRRGLDVCIRVLRGIRCPAILVAGNNETTDELRDACRTWDSAHVLHGTGVTINGTSFFGLGGGIPVTPFGSWSYDLTEEQAGKLLEPCPPGAVLISHSPPKGVVDVSARGQNLGSTAVLAIIKAKSPGLVVCGHIHASSGQTARIGSTVVINAGPKGMFWDLFDSVKT